MYQRQLNRLTHYILEHPDESEPGTIVDLEKTHDISMILAQMDSEKAAELALWRAHRTGRVPTALDSPRISRYNSERRVAAARPMADANARSQGKKMHSRS